MNYERQYQAIIENARQELRKRKRKGSRSYVYYEEHHISPECMGGSSHSSNLVLLTAREHIIVHLMLAEIHPKVWGLQDAVWRMLNDDKHKVSSRTYEKARLRKSDMMSASQLQRLEEEVHEFQRPEVRAKHAARGRLKATCQWCGVIGGKTVMARWHFDRCKLAPTYSAVEQTGCEWCNKTGEVGAMRSWHGDNCRHNPANADRPKKARKLVSERPDLTCSWCYKTGGYCAMRQWHFDNCLQKPSNLGLTRKQIKSKKAGEPI